MVLIASFMILLDISIVNVAIPSVQRDLGATYAEIQWVLAGYQLAYAVVLITGGRLGDIFGRKRLFIIGVSGFTIASLICGLAPSSISLIAARVLQGLMAALMYPQVLSVIQVSFPPRERGAAFGVFGGVIGVASISGPLLGGLLIQADIHVGGTRPAVAPHLPGQPAHRDRCGGGGFHLPARVQGSHGSRSWTSPGLFWPPLASF